MTVPPTVARLKRRPEFLRAARSGLKAVQPGLILQARVIAKPDTDALPPKRCGFTVSKKVGNAVERNRARRRLKAVAEQVLPTEALDGRDYVIIGRKATLGRPFDRLIDDLKAALKRTGSRTTPQTQPGEHEGENTA